WETAKYGKIWYNDDVHDLRFVETEFPAIVFNDELSSEKTLSCEPTASSLNNNEINFRISFDESDDEDYTVIFDKNLFSYKLIHANDLKTDSETDNEKVNMPSFPSPEPTVSCLNDLDFFKDFENEFPAIVYNDALTSKSDFLTEPTLSPRHIDEFDLKDETSLSECDEEEQNSLGDNAINTDVGAYAQGLNKLLKTSHDTSNKFFKTMELKVNIVAWNYLNNGMLLNLIKNLYVSFGIPFDLSGFIRMVFRQGSCEGQDMAPLPPRDQRHPWLRYQVEGYTEDIVHNYEQRLETIFGRSVNRLGGARRRMTWRQFILALGLHTSVEMAEDGFEAYWLGGERVVPDKGDLRDYWIEISSDMDILGPAPSHVYIRDHVRRLCHMMIACSISGKGYAPEKVTGIDLFYLRSMDRGTANVPYLLAQYLFRYIKGRKIRARLFEGHFIGRLAAHFGLVRDEGLKGLLVITRKLPMIDLHELVRLNICERLGDMWAWVAPRPERQSNATASAPKAIGDAPAVDEGASADPEPIQAPQSPHATLRTMPQRIARLKEEVHKLRRSIVRLHEDVDRSITNQSRFATWMVSCMTQLMDASGRTYQAFDNTLVGSSRLPYQRCIRRRTDDASTSTAQQDEQPDP
ncbi:hypothetical protein Tco_1321634, partial [Tanacetum coccineum]